MTEKQEGNDSLRRDLSTILRNYSVQRGLCLLVRLTLLLGLGIVDAFPHRFSSTR
jgi:hypothetical protein